MSGENSNIVGLAIGAVVAGGVALLFTGSNRSLENQTDTIYQLPAVISRVEANEERINNVRRDISLINERLQNSPTTNELAVESDAIRRRLEELLADVRTLQAETKEISKDVASATARITIEEERE